MRDERQRGDSTESDARKQNDDLGARMALGVALGAGIGVAMDNLAAGIGVGIAIGAGLGAAIDFRK